MAKVTPICSSVAQENTPETDKMPRVMHRVVGKLDSQPGNLIIYVLAECPMDALDVAREIDSTYWIIEKP